MSNISLNEFSRRLAAVMPIMCKSMMQYEQNALTTGQLSLPEFWTLSLLLERGETTMHELADAMSLKASTATMLAGRLERIKLIVRKRDKLDRRKVLVKATTRAVNLVAEVHNQKRKALEKTFRHLDPHERELYLELLEKLAGRLQTK
ncbi:MAG TPA: MarR family winged helix-turn-helix transcriptional regulator [Kiritimatiellia bacterium]|nr:MarR family winged helix-turn-helix transcriptional regulator [Kiritimatiellia bacterium]